MDYNLRRHDISATSNPQKIRFGMQLDDFLVKMHGTSLCCNQFCQSSCSRWFKYIFPQSEKLYQTANLRSYRLIGEGIGCWKKSSSWQNSCNGVCWRQQWQSFSLIRNRSYREIKTGMRRERHLCTHQLQRRHFGKRQRKKVFTLHFSKLGSTKWLPYRSEKSSLNST